MPPLVAEEEGAPLPAPALVFAELGVLAQQRFDEIANELAVLEAAYTEIVSSGCRAPAPITFDAESEATLADTDFEGVVLRNDDLLLRFLAGQRASAAEYNVLRDGEVIHFLSGAWMARQLDPMQQSLRGIPHSRLEWSFEGDLVLYYLRFTLSILEECGLVLPEPVPVAPGSAADAFRRIGEKLALLGANASELRARCGPVVRANPTIKALLVAVDTLLRFLAGLPIDWTDYQQLAEQWDVIDSLGAIHLATQFDAGTIAEGRWTFEEDVVDRMLAESMAALTRCERTRAIGLEWRDIALSRAYAPGGRMYEQTRSAFATRAPWWTQTGGVI